MNIQAIRGQIVTYKDNPFVAGIEKSFIHYRDGIVVMADGKVKDVGPASEVLTRYPNQLSVTEYGDAIIMPGFIDCHVHYPQTQIIGAYGAQLLDWLNKYTFIAEQQFADMDHARKIARTFLQENLRAGTTTATVYCTVYPQSVDAFFEESEKLNMRNIAGKVMMDRNAPEALTDTPKQGYDDTRALIARWHNKGRQLYCVTPRFAATSSPEQMEMTGAVWKEHPGTYLQSHISENVNEVAWVKDLYPQRKNYVDIYDHYGQLGPRAIYGHGIHLTDEEFRRLHETGTAIAHCPTSNLFLGSGLFNLQKAVQGSHPIRVGLATDLGAGTSFSQLQTLNEAYKVAQMRGYPLGAIHAFYLATRGTAHSLYLDDLIGSIEPGMEADLVVLDLHSTPIIRTRMSYANNIEEVLFVLMTLGDDRATKATYVAGKCLYDRDSHRDIY
ncbi:MAG TPA: guanine deaminase [Spongiibacteraceae bacterium]|nr:guanine deaminase [Spongiibacteraceae bacterium]